jgi:Protein of unknown function (DUF2501)
MRVLLYGRVAFGIAALGAFTMWQSTQMPVRAQLLDQLKGITGSGHEGGALPGLGGSLPSVDQASPSNTAGVLQYCVRNNYLSGSGASSAGNSIVSKMTGSGHATDDSGFKAGNSGMLQTGNGQGYSLGGSGMKAQVTHKVCDLVLQHAKSLL